VTAGRTVRAALVAAALLLGGAAAGAARAATEEVAVVTTPQGEIVWRFIPQAAPRHVKQVKRLIAEGFYDGTTFHRVIPHFVVQGGDPNSKNADRSDDGEGETTRLPAEFSERLHYRPGTVGMARDADPDSGSCQFFIALSDLPRLDTRYTIFGEVVDGLEVARRIASLPRDLNDNPIDRVPVTIRLDKRNVREGLASSDLPLTGTGEVLTGPDKPKPWDPKNPLWSAPAVARPVAGLDPAIAHARLDVSIGPDGGLLDVRFVDPAQPQAARLWALAQVFRFVPMTYEGQPRKTRFEIDADGGRPGPPTGGGAPLDAAAARADAAFTPPLPAARVTLSAGAKPPAHPTRLRLTIDAAGAVTDAAVVTGCGDAALDAKAVEAAKAIRFTPAARTRPGRNEPEPVASYLEVEATYGE